VSRSELEAEAALRALGLRAYATFTALGACANEPADVT
jgi:hypothetical protein